MTGCVNGAKSSPNPASSQTGNSTAKRVILERTAAGARSGVPPEFSSFPMRHHYGTARYSRLSPMPRRPPFRFLLRASLLLMAMLVLWGSVLLDPLRAGLRVCTAAAIWLIPGDGSVAEAAIQPNGDWSLRLPMPAAAARAAAARAAAARQEPVQQMFGGTSHDAAPIN